MVSFMDAETNARHKAFERELTSCPCDEASTRAWMAAFGVSAAEAEDMREEAAAFLRHSIQDAYDFMGTDGYLRVSKAQWIAEMSTQVSQRVAPVLGVAEEKIYHFYWSNPAERFGLQCPCKPSYKMVDECRQALTWWEEHGEYPEEYEDLLPLVPRHKMTTHCGFYYQESPEQRREREACREWLNSGRDAMHPWISQWLDHPSVVKYVQELHNELSSRWWDVERREINDHLRKVVVKLRQAAIRQN